MICLHIKHDFSSAAGRRKIVVTYWRENAFISCTLANGSVKILPARQYRHVTIDLRWLGRILNAEKCVARKVSYLMRRSAIDYCAVGQAVVQRRAGKKFGRDEYDATHTLFSDTGR